MDELTARQLGLTAIRGKVLFPKQIALAVGMSERWVRYMIQQGLFPGIIQFSPRKRGVDSYYLNKWIEKNMNDYRELTLPKKAIRKIQEKEVIA